MKPTEVARYLQRAALDHEFRAMARTDPDASFQGFALSDAEKRILRRQDQEMMGLLARALGGGERAEGLTTRELPGAENPSSQALQALPPVDLLLQILAVPSGDDSAGLQLGHAASLHPAPAPGEPLPQPPAGAPAGAAAPVYFRIRLTPLAARRPDGQTAVTYGAAIEGHVPGETESAPATPPASAWGRLVDSDSARRAAEAVKASPPEERYERILELVATLEGRESASGEVS
jgi:hypothetical protein